MQTKTGEGSKTVNAGRTSVRNGVRVITEEEMKSKVFS